MRLGKSETRGPKAERRPKPEGPNRSSLGLRAPWFQERRHTGRSAYGRHAPLDASKLRGSTFGSRVSFGLRPSTFGFGGWTLRERRPPSFLLNSFAARGTIVFCKPLRFIKQVCGHDFAPDLTLHLVNHRAPFLIHFRGYLLDHEPALDHRRHGG